MSHISSRQPAAAASKTKTAETCQRLDAPATHPLLSASCGCSSRGGCGGCLCRRRSCKSPILQLQATPYIITNMSAHPDIEDCNKVVCVKRAPQGVDVEAGKSYWWCSCGRSKNQPFCDGSHKGTNSVPVEYKAQATEKVYFCMCRQTASKPLCDGTHKSLPVDAEGTLLPCPRAQACGTESTPASPFQLALG